MSEMAGVYLSNLQESLEHVLHTYKDMSDGYIEFDALGAAKLELTPDRTTSAESTTEVMSRGERLGKLSVIAFQPNEVTVVRNRSATAREVHINLLTQDLKRPEADPIQYAGRYDFLGANKGEVLKKIGELGHKSTEPHEDEIFPIATYTVLPVPALMQLGKARREADRYAVFSPVPDALQVCAFLALTYHADHHNQDVFAGWHPQTYKLP